MKRLSDWSSSPADVPHFAACVERRLQFKANPIYHASTQSRGGKLPGAGTFPSKGRHPESTMRRSTGSLERRSRISRAGLIARRRATTGRK